MKGRTVKPQAPQFPPVIRLKGHSREEAYAEAAEYARQGCTGLWIVQTLHDDFCRAIETQHDSDCDPRCVPDFYLMSLEAHINFMQFDARLQKSGLN